MNKFSLIIILLSLAFSTFSYAQTPQFPIVKGFGGIYEIPEATERPDPDGTYKIIIDLVSAAESPGTVNRMVDNIARMVNLHGIAGVSKDNIKVKVAIHGGAVFSALNNDFYKKLYGIENPNLPVFEALKESGVVEFYVCGQSLIARDMLTTDVWEGAEIALSMLTTLTKYVPQGYMLMRF
ncbi:Intracellular sulfur oxidation protein, DsrE/DsrF family [Belliella buryatensis]|uniref:Intracellular sulfur oxidation protein, DsrE/DsrF family n=1 Tax=Belliella buryatensis TaxID=1500549 RepID=A0A239F788_9BACT|nr:DsrE family protein [Belliella buryatensis]SNS52153.1 Intracellular sulfur oxidation protein, DsrE/DsrF family [Belliella buryatensis]